MKTISQLSARRALAAVLLALFSVTIVACATIEGAGKDIETAGEKIQDAADN